MAFVDQVGSLDAWLPKATLLSGSSSPFAALPVEGRAVKATQSMPVARAFLDLNPSMERGPHVSSETMVAQNVQASAWAIQRADLLDDHFYNEERTVRHGRLHSGANLRSDTQPIMTANRRIISSMATASSLPAMGTEAAVNLASLCTALSSPASHVTLASTSAHRCSSTCTCWHEGDSTTNTASKIRAGCSFRAADSTAAADAASSPATTAAAAAFNRSMTWAPSSPCVSFVYMGHDQHDSCPDNACISSPLLPALSASSDALFEVMALQRRPSLRLRLSPIRTIGAATETHSAASGSGRRGLVEGTVRGGSPRNVWRYVSCSRPADASTAATAERYAQVEVRSGTGVDVSRAPLPAA